MNDKNCDKYEELQRQIYFLLNSYRCENQRDEDNEGLALADVLTPKREGSIELGREEINSIAEFLASRLWREIIS